MKFLGFLAAASFMVASPITYTFTGSATGTLGSTPFTNAALTAIAIGDTSNIAPDGGGGFVNFIGTNIVSISIAGIGSGTLNDNMYVFACPSCSGFIELQSQGTGSGAFAFSNAALQSYDLSTAIGPVSGTALQLPWNGTASFGAFNITAISNPTFQATLTQASVPEPSSWALVAVALFGIAWRRLNLGNLLIVTLRMQRSVD